MCFTSGKRITDIDRRVSARLREARTARSITYKQAAKHVRRSWQMIQRYESAKGRITPGILLPLAELYGKPINWFFKAQ